MTSEARIRPLDEIIIIPPKEYLVSVNPRLVCDPLTGAPPRDYRVGWNMKDDHVIPVKDFVALRKEVVEGEGVPAEGECGTLRMCPLQPVHVTEALHLTLRVLKANKELGGGIASASDLGLLRQILRYATTPVSVGEGQGNVEGRTSSLETYEGRELSDVELGIQPLIVPKPEND